MALRETTRPGLASYLLIAKRSYWPRRSERRRTSHPSLVVRVRQLASVRAVNEDSAAEHPLQDIAGLPTSRSECSRSPRHAMPGATLRRGNDISHPGRPMSRHTHWEATATEFPSTRKRERNEWRGSLPHPAPTALRRFRTAQRTRWRRGRRKVYIVRRGHGAAKCAVSQRKTHMRYNDVSWMYLCHLFLVAE